MKNNELENNQSLFLSMKNKEQDIEKLNKDLKEKENRINNLNNKQKTLEKLNGEIEGNISDLNNKKENLIKEINQYEKELLGQKI